MLEMTMQEVVDLVYDRVAEIDEVYYDVADVPTLIVEPYGDDEEEEALFMAVCQRMLEDSGLFVEGSDGLVLSQLGQAYDAGVFAGYTFEDFA